MGRRVAIRTQIRNAPNPQIEQLTQLIDRHPEELFRFAYFRVGSRSDAEEIVQEVLLKLFHSDRDLSHVDDVKRYLMRAIANRCIDYHHRRPTVPLTQILLLKIYYLPV